MTRGHDSAGARNLWATLRSPSRPVRLILTSGALVAVAVVVGVLLDHTLLQTVRLVLAFFAVFAITEATEQPMNRLQARSGLLHGVVMFVAGVAATLLFFAATSERPTVMVLYTGLLTAISGRKRRPRKPDEDWVGATASTSRDDGRRWRTGTP